MKSIVVATDVSAQGGRAVARAAELAKMYGTALTITHVQDAKPLGSLKDFAETELSVSQKRNVIPLPGIVSMETNLGDAILAHDQQMLNLRQLISEQILERAKVIAHDVGVAASPRGSFASSGRWSIHFAASNNRPASNGMSNTFLRSPSSALVRRSSSSVASRRSFNWAATALLRALRRLEPLP
jgi:nucleotide-binding universal stress UspA family protein